MMAEPETILARETTAEIKAAIIDEVIRQLTTSLDAKPDVNELAMARALLDAERRWHDRTKRDLAWVRGKNNSLTAENKRLKASLDPVLAEQIAAKSSLARAKRDAARLTRQTEQELDGSYLVELVRNRIAGMRKW